MPRRLAEGAAIILTILLAGLLLLEAGLQLAARFARPDRSGDIATSEDAVRILCAGDSHTLGTGVPRVGSYPAQLKRRLDKLYRPRETRAFNVGVAGANTAYVANRLVQNLAETEPHALILWVGINNRWNAAETEGRAGLVASLDSRLSASRLYRLVRVVLLTREEPDFTRVRPRDWTYNRDWVDSLVSDVSDDEAERRTAQDLERMVGTSRASGVPVILIDYPWPNARRVNHAIHDVGERMDVPVVNSTEVFRRAARTHPPETLIRQGAGLHPSTLLYAKVVDELLPVLIAMLSETHGLEATSGR